VDAAPAAQNGFVAYDARQGMKWTGLIFHDKPEYVFYGDAEVTQTPIIFL
jgi:hypothetical protein